MTAIFEQGDPCLCKIFRSRALDVRGRSRCAERKEASEQQDAEVRRWDEDWRGRGGRREDMGRIRSCLREQQRTRRRIEVRKVRLEGAFITSGSGSALPPTQGSFCGMSFLWSRCSGGLPPEWSG